MEFAGHYDHETAMKLRTPVDWSKFNGLLEKFKRQEKFLNQTLMDYFENSDFTEEEIDKILNYMSFVVSQRKKKS